ncbi:hypothetical protein TURTL08_20940 [Turicimonas sp. TL08]
MKKEKAISIFGSGAALGRAVGVRRSAICYWPSNLTVYQLDRVIGAALRLNKITPDEARELIEHERQRNERSKSASN